MKKTLLLCVGVAILLIPSLVLAQTQTTSSALEKRQEIRNEARERIVARVRQAATARYTNLKRAVELTERLLKKLQIRIDRAQTAGKDVTEANKLMTEAKAKVADAKTRLARVESMKDQAVDKAGYQEIRTEFNAIRADIHQARLLAAKIIRILKGFNSATSSAVNK